jgi:translation elongation factor P/translation initiation factor 5A
MIQSVAVLYNTLRKCGVTVTLVWGLKICRIEKYSTVRVGKHVSEIFRIKSGLKQGDALSSLLFTVALEYAIWRVSAIQNGFKLDGSLQFLLCAGDVNILSGNV